MNNLSTRHLVSMAFLLSISFLTACDIEVGGKATPTLTIELTGPNAQLSNAELLKKAAANMQVLKSYHFEFAIEYLDTQPYNGTPTPESMGAFDVPYTMTVTFQPKDRGILLRLRNEWSPGVDAIFTPERAYESTDGGKTWSKPQGDGLGYLGAFVEMWRGDGLKQLERDIDDGLRVNDGDPPVEQIDGMYARHMVVNTETITDTIKGKENSFVAAYGGDDAKTISFWVTTEMSPTILQIQAEGVTTATSKELLAAYASQQPQASVESTTGIPTPTLPTKESLHRAQFRATWKWSRFNEDFGEIKPPPTVTVKSP